MLHYKGNKDFKLRVLFCLVPEPMAFTIFAPMFTSDDLQQRWWNLEAKLVERFNKKPDLETILFLIGMQETGIMNEKITKEQKQDLMHVAVCSLLMPSGYYELEGKDADGWPHFKQLKAMPDMHAIEQENFLKDHVLLYFENHDF
jgi:hypothetical protein